MSICGRSMPTTSGATTAPPAKRPRSPAPRTAQSFEGIAWCGGVYSSEWGWSKLLHWLRHNPELRPKFVTALEHCDMVAATLCGVTDPDQIARSVCAMGHKWMWNPRWGGLPPEDFLTAVDPLLAGVRDKIAGRYNTSDKIAGHLSEKWAKRPRPAAGIPIPVGAFDAHWDAIGANIRLGDVVNVIGTSTCIIGLSDQQTLVPGVCGVVPGSVDPAQVGIEAGMSAVGDVFAAIAARAGTTVAALSEAGAHLRAGQTGLLRLTWDNGDRTVLVNPALGGVTLGRRSTTIPRMSFLPRLLKAPHFKRIIFDRLQEYGVPIERVINGGGIPQRNEVLNNVYASVIGKSILIPTTDTTGLGSGIFAFLAAGTFKSVEEAQAALSPGYRGIEPAAEDVRIYEDLFVRFRELYFKLGQGA